MYAIRYPKILGPGHLYWTPNSPTGNVWEAHGIEGAAVFASLADLFTTIQNHPTSWAGSRYEIVEVNVREVTERRVNVARVVVYA